MKKQTSAAVELARLRSLLKKAAAGKERFDLLVRVVEVLASQSGTTGSQKNRKAYQDEEGYKKGP